MQRTGVKVASVGRSPALSWRGAEGGMGTPPRWQEAHRQHVAGPGRESRQRSLQIHSVLPSLSGGADARSKRTTILSQTQRTLGREEGGLGPIHRH